VQFDTEPLRIDGKPTPLESGKEDYFVRWSAAAGIGRFCWSCAIRSRGSAPPGSICPCFPKNPRTESLRVSLSPRGAKNYSVTTDLGPTSKRPAIIRFSRSAFAARRGYPADGLGGAKGSGGRKIRATRSRSMGQLYLFSTLRPEPGEAGSLR